MTSDKLYSIIEAIGGLFPEIQNIDISVVLEEYPDDEFKPGGSTIPFAQMSSKKVGKKKDKIQYEILLFMNPFEYMGRDHLEFKEAGLMSFFSSVNIPFNNTSFILFNFVHEVGHVLLSENIIKELSIPGMLRYDDALRHISYMMFDNGSRDPKSILKLAYDYSYQELYAEKFAYMNFPRVWNNVKKLIKEEI